jgi:hypothetical protein
MKINKFKNIDKENANYWKSEFESHNPKICNPLAYSLAKNLLNYGFEADNACYGNDLNHRLDFGYKGLEISIFIPNAKFTNLDKEEFASYSWQIEGENISLYSYDIDNGHFILTTEQLLIDSLLKALQEIDRKIYLKEHSFACDTISRFQESFCLSNNMRFYEAIPLDDFIKKHKDKMQPCELSLAMSLSDYWNQKLS